MAKTKSQNICEKAIKSLNRIKNQAKNSAKTLELIVSACEAEVSNLDAALDIDSIKYVIMRNHPHCLLKRSTLMDNKYYDSRGQAHERIAKALYDDIISNPLKYDEKYFDLFFDEVSEYMSPALGQRYLGGMTKEEFLNMINSLHREAKKKAGKSVKLWFWRLLGAFEIKPSEWTIDYAGAENTYTVIQIDTSNPDQLNDDDQSSSESE